jgi:hypothetical protein
MLYIAAVFVSRWVCCSFSSVYLLLLCVPCTMVTPCSSIFGGIYRVHLQDPRVNYDCHFYLLVFGMAYSSILKMEATYSAETSDSLSKLHGVTTETIVQLIVSVVSGLFIYCSNYIRQLGRPGHHCWCAQAVGTSLLQGHMAATHHPRHLPDYRFPGTRFLRLK